MDREKLGDLWVAIKLGTTPDWPDGWALEHMIIRLFEIDGASVVYPFNVPIRELRNVEQIDGFVQAKGISALIETKDYKDRLNVEPIAKLRNQLARRPAGLVGCIFNRGGFTDQALILAGYMAPQALLLWTPQEIDAVVEGENIVDALVTKHSRLLQEGVPYFDFRGVKPGGTLYSR
nr:restriction endonuclease [Rhizobium sp. 16-449-1b]